MFGKIDKKLVIITDNLRRKEFPENIILMDNVSYEEQHPWIANCDFMIIPIDDVVVCSGDTVLLTAMSYAKTVLVTSPSTLAEMYVEDGKNAIFINKDVEEARNRINEVIRNNNEKAIGENARETFLNKYSRYKMGKALAKYLV